MIQLYSDSLKFSFLESGDLFEAKTGDRNINLLKGNVIDGSLNNIYLRLNRQDGYEYIALLGKNSNSQFYKGKNSVKWTGNFMGVDYEVKFYLYHNIFYYNVSLSGSNSEEIELFFCNDIALSKVGNEAYIGQYIDHKPVLDKNGFTILSRQNQQEQGENAFIQLGSLCENAAYSTDGFQFFGKEYKVNGKIKALEAEMLDCYVYQYEFPFIAIQTKKVKLQGNHNAVFYGYVLKSLEGSSKEVLEIETIIHNSRADFYDHYKIVDRIEYSIDINSMINGNICSQDDIDRMYAHVQCPEYEGGNLISFFDNEKHIVLQRKEELVERQHGNILISAKEKRLNGDIVNENIISTTSYMSGIFNSHVVVGNTSMNIFMSYIRNPLNIMRMNGQRIFIKINDEFRLLCQPSIFEMGLNYCKWVYQLDHDTLTIINRTKLNSPVIFMEINSQNAVSYEFIISAFVCMGEDEFNEPGEITVSDNKVSFFPPKGSAASQMYPDLNYSVEFSGTNVTFDNDSPFYKDHVHRVENLYTFHCSETNNLKMYICGSVDNREFTGEDFSFINAEENYLENYGALVKNFKLYFPDQRCLDLERLNKIVYWYTSNMLIHYTMPHGLEQYGGAAWGTRDVCQGPFEYFMCMQDYKECRKIIERVFSYQFFETGNWPQWFMIDRYTMRQNESHGDVVIWPLKCLANYISVTGDYEILNAQIPFSQKGQEGRFTGSYSLMEHVNKQLDYISNEFYKDTYLPKYGEGDWDDTLQPSNKKLRERMISGWTTSLLYETLSQWYEVFPRKSVEEEPYKYGKEKLKAMVDGIRDDYHKYLVKDDVVSGFIHFDSNEKIKYILHPDDEDTKIKYRLIPINRGIISELFTREQADHHLKIIYEHLYYADGVRLMSKPAEYKGGINTYFMRAETASNFGREIGLQYVHAHIRFIEAISKLGKHADTMDMLLKINPICIQDSVKNADYRQSNAYFSSSDGDFKNRYEAQNDFYKLRCGDLKVKAGWRIYSSGPGIYINQLITNVLGIRFQDQSLVVDPVLSGKYDGLCFDYEIYGHRVTFKYSISGHDNYIKCIKINERVMNFERVKNPYRNGGAKLDKHEVMSALGEQNEILLTL
ncbi:GH36-type glycosyl hydrolase domain-containing protein [Lacrimispora brassicae]